MARNIRFIGFVFSVINIHFSANEHEKIKTAIDVG